MGLDYNAILIAIEETLYMTFVSLVFAVIFGLFFGIILFVSKKDGLFENLFIYHTLNLFVNIFRAIPFIILLYNLIPFTQALMGSFLGARAAVPVLVFSSVPFFARLVDIALIEVDKGTIEAAKSFGANKIQIIFKILIPEAKVAIISGISVTAIALVGYTAMSGAIGSGGLGNLAYMYGLARRNEAMLQVSTILIVIIVFIIQAIGDVIIKKIDKR
ncbi:MAG: methionine ABC transporter permease [Erysipelotrichaceae bacterium]